MPAQPSRRVIRILLVDDNPIDRRAICRFVTDSRLPYELKTANSLAEAREQAANDHFDVAIVDHNLGDGSGLELLTDLPDTPTIILTGAGSEQTAAAALELRASHYLVKDVDCGYLHFLPASIDTALARKWTEGEINRYARELEREIAERKRVEESLRRSEEHLRLAMSAACLGTWEWDLLTDRVIWSDGVEAIFGLPAGGFDGTFEAFVKLVYPDDRPSVVKAIARTRDTYRVEFRVPWTDGGVRWLLGQGRVFQDADANPARMAGTLMDITDRKATEEQLQRHQEELAHVSRLSTMGEMATGLAHELNQPLAAITNYAIGCLNLLQAECRGPAGVCETLEQITTEAKRAAEIIRRIRAFVRKLESRRSSIDINALVREVIGLMSFEARNHGIVVHPALCDPLPLVLGDSIQIEQVVVNLVRNSFEAIQQRDAPERVMAIETRFGRSGRDVVEISVIDSGPGLADVDIERLFDAFFTTKPDGLGMGLSISRSIIEAHGGRLWAENHADGGAVFRFTLPVPAGVPSSES